MSPSSTSFTKTAQDAWAAVKRHAKEHHESTNAAYAAYYGAVMTPTTVAPAPSRRPSSTASSEPRRSSVDKAWSKVKKHAREHHQGVTAAYTTYYGIGTSRTQTPASSTENSPRVSVDRE
ncbi:hypothetical protein JX266_010648 [Neoarthrinium moseri]|nr:hypothetical protein JX266_010648 [Neoarthrinium moseri]